VRRHHKVRDDGHGLDLLGPRKLDVVADADGRLRRLLARVDAAGRRRQDLAQGNLDASHVLGLQGHQVRADEATKQRRADIVGMSLNHQTVVEQAVVVEVVQAADLLAQQHAGHDGGAGASQATAQGDRVLDVDVGLDGEGALVMASQHIQRDPGDEVDLGVEADVVLALALVGDAAVQRLGGRGLGAVDGDVQLEVDGEGEADDIEAGADVGAGRGRLDDE